MFVDLCLSITCNQSTQNNIFSSALVIF